MRFSSMFAPEIITKEKKPIFVEKESEKKLQITEIKENYENIVLIMKEKKEMNFKKK